MDIKAADADQDAKAKEEEEKAIWRKEREAAKASITQPPRHYNRVPATPAPSLHEDDDGDDDSEGNDHYSNHLARMEHDRRKSSQSTRPTMRDLHGEYVYKPKVKLGPRPSLDIGGRPHTSGSSSRSKEPRPISTLPAGIRIPSKKPTPRRPQSQHSTSRSRTIPNLSQAPPIPNLPNLNQSAPAQAMPNVETAVVNPTQPQSTSKPSGMTPEKQRLMKALQLRKRQMAMAAASKETRTKSAQVSQAEPEESAPQQEREVEIIPAGLDEAKKCIDVNRVRSTAENDEDSGSTFPASSPISPSEGPSTQASSFTDENKHSANVVEEKIAKHGSHGPVGAIMMSQVTQVDQACSPTEETTEILPVEIPLPPVTKQEARSLVQAADTPLKSSPETGFQDSVDEIEPVAIYVTSNTQDGEEDFFDTRPSTAETLDQQSFEKPTKRGGLIDPIRIVSSAENSDDNYLSDDSFMEELKSATVQEAKPVSVAKSPINPMFANNLRDRRPSDVGSDSPTTSGTALNRRAAGPSHLSPNTPAHNYTRSMSAPYESVGGSQQALALMAKKINVSSGISRRIKALELVSSRATSPATPSPISAIVQNSSPPFAELRKASLRSLSSTSESVIRQENRVPNTTPYPTPISSPISPTPQEVVSRKSRPESISVTARILRDCNNVRPEVPTDPSEPIPLYLHHSPLTVKHQKATTLQTDLEHRKPEGTRLADGSLPEANDDSHTASSPSPVPTPRRSSASSRHKSETSPPRSTGDTSPGSLESVVESVEEKKESRKSRLLRRMSSLSSASRKSIVQAFSPTSKPEDPIAESEVIPELVPTVVEIGDLNVQFPDTLVRIVPQYNGKRLLTHGNRSSSGREDT